MKRTERGTWFSTSLNQARAFHAEYGGILLSEADGYYVCVFGCGEQHCQCRGDVDYIDGLAPSWDETHKANKDRVPNPTQATLF